MQKKRNIDILINAYIRRPLHKSGLFWFKQGVLPQINNLIVA